MPKEPKIELDVDDNLKGQLVITCPECHRKFKKPLQNIAPEQEESCSCGYTVKFGGDDVRELQKSLDSLKKTLSSFGK